MGIASILHVSCNHCGAMNDVKTSQTHKSGSRGPLAFDSNTRAVLASLDTGIGESHLSRILSTLNIPPPTRSTFKKREREIGKAVERVAKRSCTEATNKERLLAIANGNIPDSTGLVDITCSYDMGWQKRGRAFNSSTGHGATMSMSSGKVLAYGTRNKKCRSCDSSVKAPSKLPKVHNCRKNYNGSSKYMETDVACDLFKAAPENQVKYSAYIGDDDSTTLAELVKTTPYKLQKFSDIIHIKRSLSTRLYNLSQRAKFQNCSVLSQKVINYLLKCFSYCVNQNKNDTSALSTAISAIVPHAFGDHKECDTSWCRYNQDPAGYTHRELPYGKNLHGEQLRQALENILSEYTTDIVLNKLSPCYNSQRNKSLNGTIG